MERGPTSTMWDYNNTKIEVTMPSDNSLESGGASTLPMESKRTKFKKRTKPRPFYPTYDQMDLLIDDTKHYSGIDPRLCRSVLS